MIRIVEAAADQLSESRIRQISRISESVLSNMMGVVKGIQPLSSVITHYSEDSEISLTFSKSQAETKP